MDVYECAVLYNMTGNPDVIKVIHPVCIDMFQTVTRHADAIYAIGWRMVGSSLVCVYASS